MNMHGEGGEQPPVTPEEASIATAGLTFTRPRCRAAYTATAF